MTINARPPAFSIVTICRNNPGGLKKTAESIAAQTSKNYEWIVIDGASTDETKEILKTLPAEILSEPDNGIYDAMNKGIARASGDYLLFLNAGDALAAPSVLRDLEPYLEQAPALLYGDSLEAAPDTPPAYKPARSHQTLAAGLFTHHQAMLYNRAALGGLRYNTRYRIAADYDLTAALLQNNADATHIARPVCVFESGGVSQTAAYIGRKEQYEIRKARGMVSPLANGAIFIAQSIIWSARATCPNLYWAIKSRARPTIE